MDMLGEYILFCLVFVVLAILEFALVIMLNRRTNLKKTQKKVKLRLLREKNNAKSQKHGVAKIAFLEDHSRETWLSNTNQNSVKGTERDNRGMEFIPSISPIHVIDLTAAFVFSLAFVIYNCFYWSRDLDEGKIHG